MITLVIMTYKDEPQIFSLNEEESDGKIISYNLVVMPNILSDFEKIE